MPSSRVFWKFPVIGGESYTSPEKFAKGLRRALQRGLVTVQSDHAYYALRYLMSFGYHAQGTPKSWTVFGPSIRRFTRKGLRSEFKSQTDFPDRNAPAEMGGGWSMFYAVNWRVGAGNADTRVGYGRRRFDEIPNRFAQYMPMAFGMAVSEIQNFASHGAFGRLHVTNSVWYGDWLNRGGYELDGTFCRVSKPNRFIEQCEGYLLRRTKMITEMALARAGLPVSGASAHSPRFAALPDALS